MKDKKVLAERLRLYLICGEGDAPAKLIDKCEAALRGGVTAVQLRVKSWTARECYSTALELGKLCSAHGALFIINDRLDIALAAGADGVHLGQKDLPVSEARKIAGENFIIGGTARTRSLAAEAEAAGADYVGCGAAFETATKGDAVVIGPSGIKQALSTISIPSVAIGGITISNMKLLAGCGASGVSLSSAVMSAEDPEAAARVLRAEADKYFA